jgi:hypothetical protein
MVNHEFIVQEFETHSVFFSQVLSPEKPAYLLGWGQILLGLGSFLMTPSKQALMRVN